MVPYPAIFWGKINVLLNFFLNVYMTSSCRVTRSMQRSSLKLLYLTQKYNKLCVLLHYSDFL